VPCESDDLPIVVYAARLANAAALGALDAPRLASGAAMASEPALAACMGEAVERYAAAWIPPGQVTYARAGDLTGEVLTPDRFALFSAAQYRSPRRSFPFHRWRPGDVLGWARARSLVDDRPVWLPAVFVYQPYVPGDAEPLIAPCLSTGLACSTSWPDAVLGGLCEVIERDAVALSWLGWVQPPAIELGGPIGGIDGAADVASLMETLTERGFRWRLFDLTTDLAVPVAAAIVVGRSPVGPIVAFGSACHPGRERALRKALIEAAHCRMYVKSLLRSEPGWRAGRRFENVTSFAAHGRFYTTHPEHRAAIDRWWRARAAAATERSAAGAAVSDAAWIERISRQLAGEGLEVLAVDLTTPDVEDLGLAVARVLVPGLQPLHGNHAWPHLGGARLRELSRVFGAGTRTPERWNRYPHPCP
jgi:ribosomal protein S12 methylthiotransferase accessory factor